jgi:DUF1680 family protein
MDRRELLKTTLLSGLNCMVAVNSAHGDSRMNALGNDAEYIRKEIPSFQVPAYQGESYEDVVPDTLDLQERAKLAVHGITSITDPKWDYEIFWLADFFRNPPIMLHEFGDWCQNVEGIMEVLPLLRTVTGSELNSQVDMAWMRTLLESIGPDGLSYVPLNGRPWARLNTAGVDPVWKSNGSATWSGDARVSQVANACTSQRVIGTMTTYYLRDRNEMWKLTIEKMIGRLSALAIQHEDYCYFPAGSCEVNATIDPRADMPIGSLWGCTWNSRSIQGLAQYFKVTGYEPAIELAGKLAKYTRYHGQIFDPEGRWLLDPEASGRRLFSGLVGVYDVEGLKLGGHGHGHGIALLSLLEYATATGDKDLLQFCRASFEWASNPGSVYGVSSLVGWFPEWYLPEYPASESCTTGDMLAIAVKLSLAGIGDYWDDIDRWVRNHFAEAQLTRPDLIYRLSADQPRRAINENETADHVAERSVGVWAGWAAANEWAAWIGIQHCCTGNAPRGLYYVWNSMIEHSDNQLRINLLLNRASQWADVYSHIPFEGRVDLRIKQECKSVLLRAPEWIETNNTQLVCDVNGVARMVTWRGRYVEIGSVQSGDKVVIKFPIPVRTVRERIGPQTYTLIIKGSTVVSIDPPGEKYPLYHDRAIFLSGEMPSKKVERFIAATNIAW